MKNKPLPLGTLTTTMEVGNKVEIEIYGYGHDEKPFYGYEYVAKYIGTRAICLDLGQNWFLYPGDTFYTHDINIKASMKEVA